MQSYIAIMKRAERGLASPPGSIHNDLLTKGNVMASAIVREQDSQVNHRPPKNRHPLHCRWRQIIKRCENPRDPGYSNYGGRGITLFPDWRHSFWKFVEYIESNLGECPPGFSLDRTDNDKGYEPGNLRWADRKTQNRNQRRVRRLASGESILDAAERIGVVCPVTARERVQNGWKPESAISSPPKFSLYQTVESVEKVECGNRRHLMLHLECGCVTKRQWRNHRPIPTVALCRKHMGNNGNG